MSQSAVLLDSSSQPTSTTLLRSMLLAAPVADGIEVLLWPEEDARRRRLVEAGVPCLLILGPEVEAPTCGPLEDWVRPPQPVEDVVARCVALRCRVLCAARPELDPNGALWFGGHSVAVPAGQQALLEVLLVRYRSVVRHGELAAAYGAGGGRPTDDALKAAMVRLAPRVASVGLALRSIRGRGYLLEATHRCGEAPEDVTEASEMAL
jgi:hypothetical protein